MEEVWTEAQTLLHWYANDWLAECKQFVPQSADAKLGYQIAIEKHYVGVRELVINATCTKRDLHANAHAYISHTVNVLHTVVTTEDMMNSANYAITNWRYTCIDMCETKKYPQFSTYTFFFDIFCTVNSASTLAPICSPRWTEYCTIREICGPPNAVYFC